MWNQTPYPFIQPPNMLVRPNILGQPTSTMIQSIRTALNQEPRVSSDPQLMLTQPDNMTNHTPNEPIQHDTSQESPQENVKNLFSNKFESGKAVPNAPDDNSAKVKPKFPNLKKTPKIICPICGRGVSSNANLQQHLSTHSETKTFQCLMCKKRYKDRSGLKLHQKSHGHLPPQTPNILDENISRSLCELCGSSFSSCVELQNHKKKYSKLDVSCANDIHSTGKSIELIKERKSIAGRPKKISYDPVYGENEVLPSFMCSYCGTYFYEHSELLDHKTSVHGVKNRINNPQYRCDHCGRRFGRKEQLTTHLNAKPRKNMKCPGNTDPHKRVHCSVCRRSFSHKRNLENHLKTHDKNYVKMKMGTKLPKKFQCDICFNWFVDAKGFEKHVRRHYVPLEPIEMRQNYQCVLCKKKLTKKRALVYHLVLHYRKVFNKLPKKYKCCICSQGLTDMSGYRKHVARHQLDKADSSGIKTQENFECALCKKTMTSQDELIDHVVNGHKRENMNKLPKKFKCDVCFQRYTCSKALKKHLAKHNNNGQAVSEASKSSVEEIASMDTTSNTSIKAELGVSKEMCVETDITSVQVDVNKDVVLKSGKIKQEPLEIHEDKVDHMFNMTCKTPIEVTETDPVSELGHTDSVGKQQNDWNGKQPQGNNSEMKEESEISDMILECSKCMTCFQNRSEYRKHVKSAHASEVIGRQAGQKEESDQVSVDDQTRLKCENCPRDFANQSALTNHIKMNHPEQYRNHKGPSNTCQTCYKTFTKPSRLARHEAIHNPDLIKTVSEIKTEFKCQKCERYLASKAALTNHIRIEHPALFKTLKKETCVCSFCGKEFISPSKLARHTATHKKGTDPNGKESEAVMWCEVCSRPCETKIDYTNHIRDEHCDQSALSGMGGTWVDNMWTCNGSGCVKTFTDRSGLSNHIRSSHPDLYITLKKVIYKCKHCAKEYLKPNLLAKHVAAKHGNVGSLSGQTSGHEKGPMREQISQTNNLVKDSCGDVQTRESFESRPKGGASPFGVKDEPIDQYGSDTGLEIEHSTQSMSAVKKEPMVQHSGDLSTNFPQNGLKFETPDTRIPCGICKVSFRNIQEKEHHIHRMHKYKCSQCERHFRTPKRLAKHTTTHHHNGNPGRTWTCVAGCEGQYTTQAALTKHIIDEHSDKNSTHENDGSDGQIEFSCQKCLRCFANKAALTNHIRTSHPELFEILKKTTMKASYKCKNCEKHFPKPYKLAVHAATHRGTQSLPANTCPGCGQHFLSRELLVSHIRESYSDLGAYNTDGTITGYQSAQETSMWKCRDCDFICDSAHRLARHASTHTGYRKHQCKEPGCDYRTNDKTALVGHVRKHHTHDLPFVCQKCGLQFELQWTLNKHLRKQHPNTLSPTKKRISKFPRKPVQRPKIPYRYKGIFPCHICGRTLTSRSHLLAHIRKHQGVRHPCSMCTKHFASRSILTDHIKVAHSDLKPHRCIRCGETFALRGQLRKHKDRVRKCAPILSASIGQEAMGSSDGKELSSSIGQEVQAGIIFNRPDNNSTQPTSYPFLGQQAFGFIGQPAFNSQQPSILLSQDPNDSFGHQIIDSSEKVQKPKIFPCDFCQKSFTSKQGLQFHRQGQHLGERKYKCSFPNCNKGFTKMCILKEHERLHSDVFEFSCERCGRQFKQSGSYYAHKRRKTGCTPNIT